MSFPRCTSGPSCPVGPPRRTGAWGRETSSSASTAWWWRVVRTSRSWIWWPTPPATVKWCWPYAGRSSTEVSNNQTGTSDSLGENQMSNGALKRKLLLQTGSDATCILKETTAARWLKTDSHWMTDITSASQGIHCRKCIPPVSSSNIWYHIIWDRSNISLNILHRMSTSSHT